MAPRVATAGAGAAAGAMVEMAVSAAAAAGVVGSSMCPVETADLEAAAAQLVTASCLGPARAKGVLRRPG